MRKLLLIIFLFVMFVLNAVVRQTAAETSGSAAGPTVRVSLHSSGAEADKQSDAPDISADGRFVAFSSDAANLVGGDNNGARDIFVRDRQTGVTERVSRRSDGGEANGDSFAPAISDDGRFVAFYSSASKLVDNDTNSAPDVFLYDREQDKITLVSFDATGSADGASYDPDISANGRYITFWSSAPNLVAGDNNGKDDVFRYDRVDKVMLRVSVDSNENEGIDHSHHPTISGDGQQIAFVSAAANLVTGDGNGYTDVFVRDVTAGTTSRISVHSNGAEANGSSWQDGWTPVIADNGQFVAFVSFAINLIDDDTNGYPDVFVRNLATNSTERVSLASSGAEADDWVETPSLSADGRFVAFQSYATTLAPGNIANVQDVFIRDRQAGTLARASVNSDGAAGNQSSRNGKMAGDGRTIAFASLATNLVTNDDNNVRDVFVHDRLPPPALSASDAIGRPGSSFAFTGDYFAASETAQIWVNGVLVGSVNADGDGRITFVLLSSATHEEGTYVVTLVQGTFTAAAALRLDDDAPLRSNGSVGFDLPLGVAYTHDIFLPVTARQ